MTEVFSYGRKKRILSAKTSETMQDTAGRSSGKRLWEKGICERVSYWRARQRLPRLCQEVPNKYISSFIGFAPAEDPQVLGMCVIYNPKGIYYGGTIAAPVIGDIFREYIPVSWH